MENIRCPYCNKSYYKEGLSTATAMYFQPIYKDGININPDKNIHTVECKCLNCGKGFKVINGIAEKVEM